MYFTESHEWIAVSGKIGTVGVTQHAQKELGDIVFVELPKIGRQVKAAEEAAVLESTKAAADIYAPVSGTIVEVNGRLKENSQLVNESPEENGWIFKLELTNADELGKLLNKDKYQAMLGGKGS
jgi:glycine cleavage system H protein